jgi:hypothetical protein
MSVGVGAGGSGVFVAGGAMGGVADGVLSDVAVGG